MTSLLEIRDVMLAKCAAFTGIASDQIIFADQPQITVPKDGIWCLVTLLNNASNIVGIGAKPCTRRYTQIQITCFARPNAGNREVTRIADLWLNHLEYFVSGGIECRNGEVINDQNEDWIIRIVRVPIYID